MAHILYARPVAWVVVHVQLLAYKITMLDILLAFTVVTFSILAVGVVVAVICWLSIKIDGGSK